LIVAWEPIGAADPSYFRMTRQEIRELATIFQREHGLASLRLAQSRRDEHAPGSDAFELWGAIADELQPVSVEELGSES
jgi:hypothetical protein